jgi:hypothetical protein
LDRRTPGSRLRAPTFNREIPMSDLVAFGVVAVLAVVLLLLARGLEKL